MVGAAPDDAKGEKMNNSLFYNITHPWLIGGYNVVFSGGCGKMHLICYRVLVEFHCLLQEECRGPAQ